MTHEVRSRAQREFELQNPKPKWEAPEDENPPLVIRHSNGRLWWEVTGLSVHSDGSVGEIHISFRDKVDSATLKLSQLELLRDEIGKVIVRVSEINLAKQAHLNATQQWEIDKEAYLQNAVNEYEATLRKERREAKKAEKNDG